MGVYIGVDFHARTQSVCWCDTATGEIQERVLDHQRDDVRAFYAQFAAPAVVGLESSGYALWFHQLVEELGLQLRVGNAFAIRQFARRRQKNDRRDAELLLDLLLRGDFPAVHVPCPASRDVLSLLRYRHRLVRIRTMRRCCINIGKSLILFTLRFSPQNRNLLIPLSLSGIMQQRPAQVHLTQGFEQLLRLTEVLCLLPLAEPGVGLAQ